MVQYRTEYMADGTSRLPSKMIASTRELWSSMQRDGFSQGWNEAQERTLIFVPGSIVDVAEPASRVQMNAKQRRP
jgi:hypothetical protein